MEENPFLTSRLNGQTPHFSDQNEFYSRSPLQSCGNSVLSALFGPSVTSSSPAWEAARNVIPPAKGRFLYGCQRDEQTFHCGRHVISTRMGISFFTGIVSSEGGSILKSVSVAGIVPDMRVSFPCVAN